MRGPGAEPAEFITCRTLGHSWDVIPLTPDVAKSPRYFGTVIVRFRCTRCNMERFDEVSRMTGHVEHRKYTQPSGYHRSKEDAVARDAWRKAFLGLADTRAVTEAAVKARHPVNAKNRKAGEA